MKANFDTNKLDLPLLVACSIDASETTFPFAFSYIINESAEAFDWFFESLDVLIFHGGVEAPRVILSDLAADIIAHHA